MLLFRGRALFLLALCWASSVLAQSLDERVLGVAAYPNYDRTRNFFVVVDVLQQGCGWPSGRLQEMSAQQVADELRIQLVAPPATGEICAFGLFPRNSRYLIPVARLLADVSMPAKLKVDVQFVKDDGAVRAGALRLDAGPRAQSARVEPGRWDGLYGSALQVDHHGDLLQMAFTSTDIGDPEVGPVFDWPMPGAARAWIAKGSAVAAYFRAPLTQLDPVLEVGPSGVEVGRFPSVSTAGDLLGAMVSPTRMLLSLPNGRQFEARRHPGAGPGRAILLALPNQPASYASGLQGNWDWVGSRRTELSGKRLAVQALSARSEPSTLEWKFGFDGGAGRVYCDKDGCTLYATLRANQLGAPLEQFPLDGIGSDRLYARDHSGAWHTIAYRVD